MVVDELDHARQGREIAELQVRVARDVVGLADGGEHLGLLDGVDAEVGFQVEIEVQHVSWGSRSSRRPGRGFVPAPGLRPAGRAGAVQATGCDGGCRLRHRFGRRHGRRAGIADAQGAMHDLQVRRMAGDPVEPGLPRGRVGDAIAVAQARWDSAAARRTRCGAAASC